MVRLTFALGCVLLAIGCGGSVSAGDGAGDATTDATTDTLAFDVGRSDTRRDAPTPVDASTTCPATVPDTGAACGPISLSCTYPGACGTDFAQCVDGKWNVIKSACGTEYCPYAGPAPGASCGSTEGYVCEYPKGTVDGASFTACSVCVCKGGVFVCDERPLADCPLRSCKSGDACSTPAMIGCEYGGKCGTSCRCQADGKLFCPTRLC